MSDMVLTQEEVRERRSYFLNNSQNVQIIKKGRKRVGGTRICSICQTQLSNVILATGETKTTRDHYLCKVSDLLTINMCKDSRTCQSVHRKRRGE